MDAPQLMARLNSSGTHVVCGMGDCGTRLAVVDKTAPEDIEELRLNSPADVIQFPPGWVPQGGVWLFTKYAEHRSYSVYGRRVKSRRYPKNNGLGYHAVMDSIFDNLPVHAKCPKCGFLNLLTNGELGNALVLRLPAEPMRFGQNA